VASSETNDVQPEHMLLGVHRQSHTADPTYGNHQSSPSNH